MAQMNEYDLKIAKMHEMQTYVSSRNIAGQLGISASTVRRKMIVCLKTGIMMINVIPDNRLDFSFVHSFLNGRSVYAK